MNLLRIANKISVIRSAQSVGGIKHGIALLSLLISACSGLYTDNQLDGAGMPVNADLIADATPIVEPITRAGNTSPYQQFGKTYQLMTSSKGYSETGIASWYGSKFHGRKTANGDTYNMYRMTAAHKTLPIPTYVKVTNRDNQRSIIVRVNDRGPFHEERMIDLSYVAALKLGFAEQGTANVLIEAIDPIEYNAQKVSKKTYLQLGSFSNRQAAITLATELSSSLGIHLKIKDSNRSFKVLLGPIANDGELLRLKQTLKQKSNLSAFTVKF